MAQSKETRYSYIFWAKALADVNVDIRNKNFKLFKKWFSKEYDGSFKEIEMMKIWKGLFYLVWHCDKPINQSELCDSVGNIINIHLEINKSNKFCIDLVISFVSSFFLTMKREWSGIDRYRLDKFYMLFDCLTLSFFRILAHYINKEEFPRLISLIFKHDSEKISLDYLPQALVLHFIENFWKYFRPSFISITDENNRCVFFEHCVEGLCFLLYCGPSNYSKYAFESLTNLPASIKIASFLVIFYRSIAETSHINY
ncbi:hypothetical protein HZS_7053 [Henneguya salminicola]|nr:hypothetical protein HZS_7053 [Henneguya salminicola]